MIFPKEFHFPQKTLYEKGSLSQIAKEVSLFGNRGVVVHGRSLEKNGHVERMRTLLQDQVVSYYCRDKGEPTLEEISAVIDCARAIDAAWIVGIGGGSVLDLAKAAAGLLCAEHPPLFYQEGGVLERKGLPFVAVPTTAGTGSEATSNSVIINPEKRVKLSIRDQSFLARTVILDSDLMTGIPRAALCYAAMDAYVQSYESFVSRNATWITEALALQALRLIDRHIIGAFETRNEDDLHALLLASYFAGIALHSSRLGVIHGLAHPLGVLYHEPHGLICAACFVPSIKINQASMGQKYDQLTDVVNKDFLDRIQELVDLFSLSSPFQGQEVYEKEMIIDATLTSGSTAANPKSIERADVELLLQFLF